VSLPTEDFCDSTFEVPVPQLLFIFEVFLAVQECILSVVDLVPKFLVCVLLYFLQNHIGFEKAIHQFRLRRLVTQRLFAVYHHLLAKLYYFLFKETFANLRIYFQFSPNTWICDK
jgi:hypothetical protein